MSQIYFSTIVDRALAPIAQRFPYGMPGLALDEDLAFTMLTHPDEVKIISRTRYGIILPNVGPAGYEIYDHHWTFHHRVVYDELNPLNRPEDYPLRRMNFGTNVADQLWVEQRPHKEPFYIRYTSVPHASRVIMVVLVDAAIIRQKLGLAVDTEGVA